MCVVVDDDSGDGAAGMTVGYEVGGVDLAPDTNAHMTAYTFYLYEIATEYPKGDTEEANMAK